MGDVVGQYELQRVLGKGGMATVWLGEHRSGIGLRAAVKILHPHLAADDDLRQQLATEARTLARLRHANLVQLLDFVPAGESLALVTELVEGRTLSSILKDGGLSWSQAVDILRQLLHGVGHAHERDCLHLDLKPSNMMVTPEGRLKVLDFGLAAVLEDGTAKARLQWATPAYMAPEQHDERDDLGPFTDLYSIGVVLFEMLLGRDGRGGLVLRVQNEDRERLDADGVPRPLQGLLDSLLQLLPFARPASCADALDRLADLEGEALLGLTAQPTYHAPDAPDEVVTAPTASRPSRSTNVRPSLHSFVGREDELSAMAASLDGETRVLTLHGLGGCGKSRLALRFAEGAIERFPGGLWHCDLADATTADGLCAVVAQALEVDLLKKEPVARIADVLAERGPALVVLDHADGAREGVIEAMERWTAAAPKVRFVVTASLPLELEGELRMPVGPLPVGSSRKSPAVALFVQRAREADPTFSFEAERAEVLQIVRELDGLPLALEIAAARVGKVPLKQIRHRLMAGDDESGEALRGALAWSWRQLQPFERAALATLSVFQGSFSTEAAAAVLDLSGWSRAPLPATVLRRLMDGGLLRSAGPDRVALLHSIQAFATDRMKDPDAVVLRDGRRATGSDARAAAHHRHAAHFARFGLPDFLDSLDGPGGVELRGRLSADLDNLGVAATRAAQAGWLHEACACAIAVAAGVRTQGPLSLGRRLIDAVLGAGDPSRAQRAHLLLHRGSLARQEGRKEAEGDLTTALELLQKLGDRKAQGDALRELGMLARERGRMDEARERLLAALNAARVVHDRRGEGRVLGNLAVLSKHVGEPGTAQGLYEVALALHRDVGNRRSEGIHLAQLALLKQELGDLEEAEHLFGQALAITREVGNRRVEAQVLGNLALVHKAAGRKDKAARLLRAAMDINRHVGARRSAAVQAGNLGDLCLDLERPDEARTWLRRAVVGCQELGFRLGEGAFLGSTGTLALREGQIDNARAYLATGESLLRDLGNKGELGKLLCRRAEVDLERRDIVAAAKALKEAEGLAFAIGAGQGSELRAAIDGLRAAFPE